MEKINKLKNKLKEFHLDGYLIPKNDEFFNEYVQLSQDDLQYITNFSGSYGLALILKERNFLFVDGRYTIQANNESGKNFKVLPHPLLTKNSNFKLKNKKIGFDPKLFNENFIKKFSKKLNFKSIPVNSNLVKLIRKNKNNFKNKKKFYVLDEKVTGESCLSKIKNLKKYFIQNKIDIMLLTASENIAWLLNIRGHDSDFSPLPNCYLIIDKKMQFYLFSDLNKVDSKFQKKLSFVRVIKINELENFLKRIKNQNFLIDDLTCSVFYKDIIRKGNHISQKIDPIYYLKSQKNKIELKNMKKAHQYDGAALTKFLFWIKNNYKKRKITELTAQEKLLKFRKQFKKFKYLSFPTISSTGPNGAIVHYNATKKTNRVLKQGNIYLVDSGGQYHYGTTDVTRTISLESKSKKIKEIFTKVLQGHLNLANYKIKKNTSGSMLDKVARKNLKSIKLDYSHGTGHGVGYFLNVHEGPHSISKFNKISLKPGMVLSNEPGYYKKGKFGLRVENLIYTKKIKNGMKFNNLTFAPIDKNLIVKKLLNKREILWLNRYHKDVYKNIKKYMDKKELNFLKESCSNI